MGNTCYPVGVMAGDEDNTHPVNPHPHNIQSQHADLHSYVIFYNRTCRKIDILWCNYSGKEVRYKTLQSKNLRLTHNSDTPSDIDKYFAFPINTFVTHPWIARDASNGQLLQVNCRKYFLPKAYEGEERRQPVYVDIPVFSLRDRCIEEVKKLVNVDQLSANEIPASLIASLKTNQSTLVLKYEDQDVNGDD